MKSPLALFLVSVLTFSYVVFQVLSGPPRVVAPSDVALIHYAIQHGCGFCQEPPVYGVDTAFQPFGIPKSRADKERERLLRQVLRTPRAAFIAQADVPTLAIPNTSPDVTRFQQQQARATGNGAPPYSLTFSAPATFSDGTTCYYVETARQDHHWGSGVIYVLRKGAIVSKVNVWVN